MTKAEELADGCLTNFKDYVDIHAKIKLALESYGRLVQEAAAKSIDDECERVLSTQRDAASGSQEDDANRYTRFMAVLLPDRAKAIREMPLP